MAGPEGWRDKEVTDLGHLLDPTGMFSLDKTICFGAYGKIDLELHEKTGSFMAIKVMNVRKTPLPGIGRRVRVNKCPKSVGWRYSDEEEDLRTVSLLRKYSSHKTVLSFYGAFFSLSPPGQRYQLWMVMELYAAGSVTDIVRVTRKQSLKEGWIAYICREILQGLAHLHAHQVIHQDIRGQNVLLTHNAEVKLVDFGVSAQVSRTNGRRNSFIGTPYWMAPEGINSDANPRRSDDYRSGVQSMGITAIEMAEGTPRYDNCQLRGDSFPKPQLSDGDFQDLAPLEALFVSLQDAAPKVKSSGWSPKFHSFMEKCMIKNVPFHPPSGSMIHHPFVHDIENERHVVESLKKHLTGIMQKRQIKDIPLVFEEEAVFKELYTTKGFREPSCTQELLRMPTSSKCTQSRWWPLPEEPQVQAGQQLQVAASVFMVLHAPDNAPKPLQRQAQEAQCLHGAAQGFMPPQAQAEARESTPSVPQMQAPPRLMGAGRVLMPLPTQGTEAEVQARVPKEQQAQTESLETEQPQDLDQVPEEFQGQDRAPEPQRQGQAAEQQQRQNPVPEQHVEQDEVPEQAEVQEEAVEPPQAEMAEKEPELVQVHARVFLPLLSQNHYVLLPLHLDTQLLIPVGEQDNESPRAQAWALEASQAFGAVQALVDGLSRNLLQAPNGSVSKPLGPLQILLENLSSNMFYTQPEEPQKKKSRVSSLKHALAKRLSPKRFRAKALWRVEDFEFSDIEAGRRRRQRRWEEIFNQHEEELREVGNDREDDSSDNDEVFHSVQAEVQVEPCAQNPAGNEVQERSASMSYSRNRAHRVKFSPSVCQESLLEEEIQEPKDTRQSSPINIQNCQAQSESSSEEASPVTRRKSQSSPPYSTIDQNLLIDIHVPDGFKVGKISPPVYLTNDWVGPSAPSEMFWDDWLIPPPARQPPVEDGDYVELYDTGANTDGEASNGAFEDAYGRGRDLNNQADQAYACRDYDDDDYDESLGAAYNRPRSRYYRRGILKRVGNDGRERKRGDFRAYGNNGARSYYGNAASGACAAFGNPEGYEANIDDRRGNRYRGANGGSEENGAFGFYGEEAHSQRDGLGLDQYEFQDFEHEQEESDGGTETSDSIALEIASFGPDDEPNNDRPESSPAAGFPITRASRRDSASDTDSASAILYNGFIEVPENPPQLASEVNVNPLYVSPVYNKPLIHVYEKEFSSEICCGSLWGVNLLLGTRSNLYLMDRSGKADVIKLIKRRPFRQIQVVEPLNLLITISGRKNRLRVYHLTWLRNKILNNDPGSKKRQKAMLKTQEACKAIDKLTGCEHFSVLQHEETTYIAVALKSSIHLFAWAPKSFDENTAIKVFRTPDFKPVTVDLSIGTEKTLKIFFSSANGYHIIDAESGVMSDVTLPNNNIIMLPDCLGIGVMLTFNAETASEEANEQVMKKILDVWKDIPTSTAFECTQRITGWDQKAIEVRSLQASILENEMKRKSIKKLRFLCARGDKLFFSSTLSNRRSRVYFMTLGKLEELQRNYAL